MYRTLGILALFNVILWLFAVEYANATPAQLSQKKNMGGSFTRDPDSGSKIHAIVLISKASEDDALNLDMIKEIEKLSNVNIKFISIVSMHPGVSLDIKTVKNPNQILLNQQSVAEFKTFHVDYMRHMQMEGFKEACKSAGNDEKSIASPFSVLREVLRSHKTKLFAGIEGDSLKRIVYILTGKAPEEVIRDCSKDESKTMKQCTCDKERSFPETVPNSNCVLSSLVENHISAVVIMHDKKHIISWRNALGAFNSNLFATSHHAIKNLEPNFDTWLQNVQGVTEALLERGNTQSIRVSASSNIYHGNVTITLVKEKQAASSIAIHSGEAPPGVLIKAVTSQPPVKYWTSTGQSLPDEYLKEDKVQLYNPLGRSATSFIAMKDWTLPKDILLLSAVVTVFPFCDEGC